MKRANAPVWVGFGTALFVVLVAGNKWASEELFDRVQDSPWLRGLLQAQWLFAPDGRPFDVYLLINSFVVVYLISLFVLLRLVLTRLDSPLVALTAGWGSSAAAGLLGGLARGLLSEITDNPFFSRTFESNVLESLTGSVEAAAPFAIWTGLLVGLGAAIATAVNSPASPAPAYVSPMPGAAQPPPPMGVPAPTPMPSPAPPTGDPGQSPPPADPTQAPPPGSF